MAEIQDFDSDELGELEVVEQQTQQQEESKQQEPDVPEKYRGKTATDLVKMHEEAEKLIARQSREVGEVRKLADELIKSQLVKPEVEKPKEIDFFENPQEAIRNAVDNNPKVLAAEQYALQVQRQQAKQMMMQKHGDMNQVIQDPDFQKWVGGSKVRQQLFRQADAYDVDAADELLSTYKELKQVKQQREVKVDNANRDRSLQSAAVDTGGSGESSKKVFRRADLIRLKMNDPDKYEAMQDVIMSAYAEGRVK